MTREEAVEYNKNLRMYMRLSDKTESYKFPEENYIALDMAIKALEQKTSDVPDINVGDMISRQAAIDAANKVIERDTSGNNDVVNAMIAWSAYIKSLPSVTPQKDDFESKQRIIDAITAKIDEIDDEKPDVIIGLITAIGVIKNLPDTTESEGYMKSALTDIGKAIMNLIEEFDKAKDNGYVRKPISYALYHTWRRWDEKEKPRDAESEGEKCK